MGTTAESRQVPLEVRTGAVLAGRYRVERVIGSGGMGVVVAAQHVHLAEPVALKFLLPEIEQDPEAKSRFAREAWTTAKIKSEHVVRVLDVGELQNGAPFIVMEYLDGTDLATSLATHGPLPIAQAVQFLLQACEGIAEAHALGIVHRDLKPSNFFCVRRSDGVIAIKVLDFGMSKLMRRTGLGFSHSITGPALIVGSPLYMSPEQMNSSKDVDARADIWSLGVMLYELLIGECPFVAESFPELAVKVAIEPPPPLRTRRPEVPKGLERIVLRCLEKDRKRRYDDVAQLAAELLEFAPDRARIHVERAARVLRPEAVVVPGDVAQARASEPHSTPPAAQSRRMLPARGGLLAGLFALLGMLTTFGGAQLDPANGSEAGMPQLAVAKHEIVPEPAQAALEPSPTPTGAAWSTLPLAPKPPLALAKPLKPRARQAARAPLAPPAAAAVPQPQARSVDPALAELDELGGRK